METKLTVVAKAGKSKIRFDGPTEEVLDLVAGLPNRADDYVVYSTAEVGGYAVDLEVVTLPNGRRVEEEIRRTYGDLEAIVCAGLAADRDPGPSILAVFGNATDLAYVFDGSER